MSILSKLLFDIVKIKTKKFISLSWAKIITFLKPKKIVKISRKQSNLYSHCSELPLNRFIDCLIDKDFEKLLKYGKASKSQLLSAFEEIFIEYCELSNTVHFKKLITLTREIGQMKSKLMAIETCVYVLTYQYSYYCVTVLKKLGYKYEFNYEKIDSFIEDLKKVATNKKSIELSIQQKEKQLNELKDVAGGVEVDKIYFDKQLIMLSKHNGYHVKKTEVTVSEYLAMMQILSDEIIRNNTENNGK